jgi:ribosomal protein S18 acetylase RimI-like enzyme
VTTSLRTATATDFGWINVVVDEWWGRPVSAALPRLFLDHFHSTSIVAEDSGDPVGFLVGFHSASISAESYIHFVGVNPLCRRSSIGRQLYENFFELARSVGRTEVKAITPSLIQESIEFHRALGFDVSPPFANYNRPEDEFVIFSRRI